MSTRIYIIVPRTVDSDKSPFKISMTCGKMAAQVAHVIYKFKLLESGQYIDDDIIVLQVPNSAELEKIRVEILQKNNLDYDFYDDIGDFFEGSIQTALICRLVDDEKTLLKHLKPWKCACNET